MGKYDLNESQADAFVAVGESAGHRAVSGRDELFRELVPEEGVEPSRGVNPTGF